MMLYVITVGSKVTITAASATATTTYTTAAAATVAATYECLWSCDFSAQ